MVEEPGVEKHEPLALEVESISHAFGPRKALDNVSFALAPSQHRVLLGLNGAGKTTLFSLITRLYDNASGSIRVFGQDVRRQPQLALRQLGVVFQQRTLDLDLSVMQNLIYHGALHGIPPARARRRAEEELERLGLAARAGEKVRTLSGGQIRRVEIARALLHQPRLLLLDEPTVGLDINSRQSIMDHVPGRAFGRALGHPSDRRGSAAIPCCRPPSRSRSGRRRARPSGGRGGRERYSRRILAADSRR